MQINIIDIVGKLKWFETSASAHASNSRDDDGDDDDEKAIAQSRVEYKLLVKHRERNPLNIWLTFQINGKYE